MRSLLIRAAQLGGALSLVLTGLVVTGNTPALAYSCSHGQISWVFGPNGVAKADVGLYWGCSDGRDHWNGTLYDTKCDAHSAKLVMAGDVIDPTADNPLGGAIWTWNATDSNGCGTYTTFSGSEPAASSDVVAGVGNCNWWEINCDFGVLTFYV